MAHDAAGGRARPGQGGSRSALQRHQTLRAAVDWSYDLLTPDEQAVFRKLAVFAGDFPLEAVEAICTTTPQPGEAPVDVLTSLVEKSLVNRVGTNVRARFRLNETMRQYALERLQEADELDATQSNHLRWYSRLGLSAEADSFSSRLLPLFDRLEASAAEGTHPADLEKWLLDWSELSAVLDEESSKRYIAMTCHTDNPTAEKAYLHFVENIEPHLKPRQFQLEKLFIAHPQRGKLPSSQAGSGPSQSFQAPLFVIPM